MNQMRETDLTGHETERGFSVAEILVATAIFAIIFTAALLMYDRSQRVFKQGVESGDMQQNTRIAFDKLVSDIRMAGYDYDRDGFPTALGQSQQPDEQIEYAGRSAITLRANFNFADLDTDGGRIEELEEPNSQFPVVTTGNDEIVTYVLVSDNGSNPDTLTFFADVTDGTVEARQAYPGGSAEDRISITGVDLCTAGCLEPPYTLMRVTLGPTGAPIRAPIANNIRNMQFTYFQDTSGGTALTITDPGGGQYNPANPSASQAPRSVRARIRAVGVTLVGMNENPDFNFTDAGETIDSAVNFRKYELNTLVVPRNIGKRGLIEQQSAPPCAPTLTSVCFGWCGVVTVNWDPPAFNAACGSAESYSVLWDTDTLGSANPQPINAYTVGQATSYQLPGLDPATEYRFTVWAANSYGSTPSDMFVIGTPKNTTTCDPPTGLTATEGVTALESQIDLTWVAPVTHDSGADLITCKTPLGGTSTSSGNAPIPDEFRGYEVWRSKEQNFDPEVAPTATSQTTLVAIAPGTGTTYSDTSAANCKNYYYRLRVVENCVTNEANANILPAVPESAFEPAVGSAAVEGRAESTTEPAAPSNLIVGASSACSGGLCDIWLEWPAVIADVNGGSITVEDYTINWDTSPVTSISPPPPISVNGSTGLWVAGGIANYVHAGMPELGDDGVTSLVYTYSVTASQCGLTSDPSPSAQFPQCTFAGGATAVVTIDSIGGSGTINDPWDILDAGGIAFVVSTSAGDANVVSVSAKAFDENNLPYIDMGTVNASPFSFNFPGGTQAEDVYRIDVRLTDTGSCQLPVSFYVKSTQVSCPFTIPAPILEEGTNDNELSITLRNNIAFNVRLARVQITWDETLTAFATSGGSCSVGSPCYSDVSGVTAPSGTGTVGSSLTGSTTTSGTFTATIAATATVLPANDDGGTYKLRVSFSKPATGSVGLEPSAITAVTIFYRVDGIDTSLDPERECVVLP